jgi:hypothetical protein
VTDARRARLPDDHGEDDDEEELDWSDRNGEPAESDFEGCALIAFILCCAFATLLVVVLAT